MNVVIMGCGRVGSELTVELSKAGHTVSIVDKSADAFDHLPPGFEAKTVVGMGFDRDVLKEAGIEEADAFLAVSSGDNSNIVSARVAREHFRIDNVIARINDPRRAEIYERLNIPTIAPVAWGVKQAMLMLFYDREDIRASMAGGSLLRVSVEVPPHLIGKPVSDMAETGRVMVAGVARGGGGFIPVTDSTFQKGDIAQVVLAKDAMDALDALLTFSEEH